MFFTNVHDQSLGITAGTSKNVSVVRDAKGKCFHYLGI